jgi:hypothetical protein
MEPGGGIPMKWELVTDNPGFPGMDGAGALVHRGRIWLLGGWNPRDIKNFPPTPLTPKARDVPESLGSASSLCLQPYSVSGAAVLLCVHGAVLFQALSPLPAGTMSIVCMRCLLLSVLLANPHTGTL